MSTNRFFFSSNGANLHITDVGLSSADPIVLLHGYPESSETWKTIIPAFEKNHRLILPDTRGYGKSEKPDGISGYDKFTMAQDLNNLLVELKIGSVSLIGHDRGARIARAFALLYPEKVRCMSLLDIVPTEYIYDDLRPWQLPEKYWHWIWNLVPEVPELLLAGHEKEFLEKKYKSPELLDKLKQNGAFDAYLDAFLAGSAHAQLNDYRAAFHIDLPHLRELKERNVKITTPTLILWGENGNLAGMPVMEIWAKVASDIRGTAILDCGHFIQEEKPEELIPLLMEFIRKH